MTETFAPQFFLLLGIDIFLGASIVIVLLDEHFPSKLPYVLELAAFVGFAELIMGPSYLTSFSTTLQFYYSFVYSTMAALSVLAANLYLLFFRRKLFPSWVVAIVTIPSLVANLFFASAYVNGSTVELPVFPIVSINVAYSIFLISGILIPVLLVAVAHKKPKDHNEIRA